MLHWEDDLKISRTSLYLDSRSSRSQCFVSHAHSDHLGQHGRMIATAATAALAEHRIGQQNVWALEPGGCADLPCSGLSGERPLRLTLRHAGHVLGSAMLHAQSDEGSLLYTGDFKLRPCLTTAAADPQPADVLVMESTYGQPFFRFPPWQQVAEQLIELVTAALREGRQPIVMGYSLGKAQEIVRILTDAGLKVTCHGAVFGVNGIYERLGVPLGKYRRYRSEDFHGPAALDVAERGVLVAPPQVARSSFVTRFDNPCTIMLSGWAMLKNAIYRYGVQHALPLSDHADFDELLELIERVAPRRIYTHHGFAEFADELRRRGHDAQLARPERQLSLF